MTFHSELRDALFASGLPFLVSINDVPEAWELYSRAGSITRLCSGKNSSKPELLVLHQGNPAVATGLNEAILRLQHPAPATRPAPGPHQGRTRPAPGLLPKRGNVPFPHPLCFITGDIAVDRSWATFWDGNESLW